MNLPSPRFCASISDAISTIQPTPSDKRRPVKMSGREDGNTNFASFVVHLSCKTFATLSKSLSIDATPRVVLMMVGQSEQSATVIDEMRNDLANIGSFVT